MESSKKDSVAMPEARRVLRQTTSGTHERSVALTTRAQTAVTTLYIYHAVSTAGTAFKSLGGDKDCREAIWWKSFWNDVEEITQLC